MKSARKQPYSRASERKKPKLPPPGPDEPWPQFVWLNPEPNADEFEEDGVTPYRDLFKLDIGKRMWKKWKAQAPDLCARTLYYVPDDLTDPHSGNDLPVLDHRVDKWAGDLDFHERIDILTPITHSEKLISLVRSYRQRIAARNQRQDDEDGEGCATLNSDSSSECEGQESDGATCEYNS